MMLLAEGASQWKDGEPYITENETMVKIIDVIVEAIQKNALYLANNWSDYIDQTIQGDMVAGVMNGNWIIPTIEQVEENSGKWEITNIPTLNGGGGYAANGGSSLYITSNCANVDLAKDFLAKTFGGSTATYDKALTDGCVITCCISAGQSEIYQAGVDYFNGQPIYTDIVGMGANVPVVEQNDYHYDCRRLVGAAIIDISQGGASTADALKDAEEQLRFQMGL
jgi:lactose/L-arabinose transport system substrate-binding protein